MHFIATIQLDSSLDFLLKNDANIEVTEIFLFGNKFELLNDVFVCTDIQNLEPLLDIEDVKMICTTAPILDNM